MSHKSKGLANVSLPIQEQEHASTGSNVKAFAIGAVLLTGTAMGAYFIVKNEIEKKKQDSAVDKSFDAGDPNNFALRLRMAIQNDHWFQWWADIPKIVQVFKEIPTKDSYKKVLTAYRNQFKRDLNSDLKEKLSQKDMAVLLQIYGRKK